MNVIQSGCLVFDIGANVGQSALLFLKHGAGRVVCVEPCLQNFVRIPVQDDIVRIHAAAWMDHRLVQLNPAVDNLGWSSVLPDKWARTKPGVMWGPPEQVPTVMINDLLGFGSPNIVKIDVEGAEFEVIQGMHGRPPVTIFEFCNVFMDDALKCLDRMRERGSTTAGWLEGELSMEIPEQMPISECMKRLVEANPRSGNLYVL